MDDHIRALVFAPEFQRLRYVRLCNINSLFLTGASEPKRFEHCIGVCHLAHEWARARDLPAREANVLRAAALLHDIQTAPFGHSFQYVMEDNPFEQKFEHANLASGIINRFHQLTQASAHFSGRPFSVASLLGELAGDVFATIEGRGPFGPLISGTLDLDNLDNVVRLAFHMGLCDDADRAMPLALAPMLEPIDGRLGAPGDAQPMLERWFELRRRLYGYLLLDRGEFAAKAMLTLAVELAAGAGLLGPDDWRLTDEGLLDVLHERSVGENQTISHIVKRLRIGDLFECVDVWSTSDVRSYNRLSGSASKRGLEQAIDDELGQRSGGRLRVCLHFILDSKKTCRSLTYHDLSSGEEKTVGYDSSQLLVGAFVTNSRSTGLTDQERLRASSAVRKVLARQGLDTLETAEEPLSDTFGPNELFAA